MKITEYKVVQDMNKHPQLLPTHSYIWNGKDFMTYDNIVDMMNKCFNMNRLNEEYVYVLAFNWNMDLTGIYELSHGTSKNSTITNKELHIFLLLSGADQFIIVHNHPNGTLEISDDDNMITSDINAFSTLLGINMIEHIIISNKGYALIQKKKLEEFRRIFRKGGS